PPLHGDARLDPGVAALAECDAVPVVLALLEQAALLAPGQDLLLGFLLREPLEARRSDEAVGADAARLRQTVVAPDLEVRRVVCGRDLEGACSEVALDALVRDHRHAVLGPRHDHFAADELRIARILR